MKYRSFFSYSSRLAKAPFSAREYIVLTPPGLKECLVLDKKNLAIKKFSIECDTDYHTVHQIYYYQDYRTSNLKRHADLQRLLAKRASIGIQSVILDVGSNIGVSARYLQDSWSGVATWCIEPSSRNVALAKKNTCETTRFLHGALGAHDSFCIISNAGSEPNSYRVQAASADSDGEKIKMYSMRSILEDVLRHGLAPFIMKVDIEGAEADVFLDASEWLPSWPLLMIELHDWMLPGSASSSPVLKAIAEGNRDVVLHGDTIISIANDLDLLIKS